MTTATTTTESAKAFHEALARVNVLALPVMSRNRHIARKEQAALARKLFRSLGLRGISVTAPRYSMAHSVDVRLPRRDDYTRRDTYGDVNFLTDPAAMANSKAARTVEEILARAFPNHDDRSDSQADYFDFKWSVE